MFIAFYSWESVWAMSKASERPPTREDRKAQKLNGTY
jgi:hypothetical protein